MLIYIASYFMSFIIVNIVEVSKNISLHLTYQIKDEVLNKLTKDIFMCKRVREKKTLINRIKINK